MKWWVWVLLAVLLILIIFLVRWVVRRRQVSAAPAATGAAAASPPDGQPAADETPTGQIPALGEADVESDVDDIQPVVAKAEPVAAAEQPEPVNVVPGSYPNSAKPLADGSAPAAEFIVKGNAGSMLYHTKQSPYFGRTKAEVWFRTPEDAEAAGFTGWNKRRSGAQAR